jgi:hypothetical protein
VPTGRQLPPPCILAGAIHRKWHASHASGANDALPAATAASTGGRIYTTNGNRCPMPDIALLKAW